MWILPAHPLLWCLLFGWPTMSSCPPPIMTRSPSQPLQLGNGFPGRSSGKGPTCQHKRHNRRRFGPRSGRPPGGGHSNPLQYSWLENPVDRGALRATIRGVTQSQTQLKRLSTQQVCTHLEKAMWHSYMKKEFAFLVKEENVTVTHFSFSSFLESCVMPGATAALSSCDDKERLRELQRY